MANEYYVPIKFTGIGNVKVDAFTEEEALRIATEVVDHVGTSGMFIFDMETIEQLEGSIIEEISGDNR